MIDIEMVCRGITAQAKHGPVAIRGDVALALVSEVERLRHIERAARAYIEDTSTNQLGTFDALCAALETP